VIFADKLVNDVIADIPSLSILEKQLYIIFFYSDVILIVKAINFTACGVFQPHLQPIVAHLRPIGLLLPRRRRVFMPISPVSA